MPASSAFRFLFPALLILGLAFYSTSPVCSSEKADKDTPIEPKIAAPNSAQDDQARKREFDQGNALFRANKFSEALVHFEKANKFASDSGDSGVMIGYCYYNLKKYPQALAQYNKTANSAKSISVRNQAQRLSKTLDSYMRGICPGNCLKPSTPGWRKMNVPGKPERLVWMVFPYLDPAGKGGSEFWSNDHMGEVIEYVNGRPIDKGVCPICGGTGKVTLPK